MRFLYPFLLISLYTFSGFSQTEKLIVFEPLIGNVWAAEGKWGDGSVFKQEVSYEFGLSGNIVIAQTKGFTNEDQSSYGNRNHGIRKFDPDTKQIRFWEFDTFNGLTEGIVLTSGKNIYYQYTYGESLITDGWEYVDENKYNFKVGVFEGGEWGEIYLQTTYERVK